MPCGEYNDVVLCVDGVKGCAVPLVTMHMPGAIGYSALNILLMEFGSLWFSLADVVGHTRPVLWVRLVWYTLSRVFSIYNTVGIARVLPWKWGAAVCTPAALLTVNNMISSLRMARSLLSSTKSAEKNRFISSGVPSSGREGADSLSAGSVELQ